MKRDGSASLWLAELTTNRCNNMGRFRLKQNFKRNGGAALINNGVSPFPCIRVISTIRG